MEKKEPAGRERVLRGEEHLNCHWKVELQMRCGQMVRGHSEQKDGYYALSRGNEGYTKRGGSNKVAREEYFEEGWPCSAKKLLLNHEDNGVHVHILIYSN